MPRKAKQAQGGGFTVMELIVAMGILAMLVGCFMATLNGIARLETLFQHESRAIVVLNNVLERLEARKEMDDSKTERILQDEFEKGGLGAEQGFSARFERAGSVVCMAILKPDGKALTQVEIRK